MKQSPGEAEFELHLQAFGISGFETEYVFAPPRRYRFDFAWPDYRLAVEIEGGTRHGGRHTRHSGFEEDCRKYNLAAMNGWKVLRFTTEMVHRAEAIDRVMEIIRV